jgi:hypothetical protein
MPAAGVDLGVRTNEHFGHFVYWAVSRYPEAEFSDNDVMELILGEFPDRLNQEKWPDYTVRTFQSIRQQRNYAENARVRLGIHSEIQAREVLRRIDGKVRSAIDAKNHGDDESQPARSFITSGGQEIPTRDDETVGWQWFNLWSQKKWPYIELSDGDTLYWYDSSLKAITWKTRVVDLFRADYRSKDELRGQLRDWLKEDPATDTYFIAAKERGYCLAYRVEPVERLSIPKPPGFDFPQGGWLRSENEVARAWVAGDAVIGGPAVPVLPIEAQRLLRELAVRVGSGDIVAGRPQTYPRYGEISDALGLAPHPRGPGVALKHEGLEDLAEWILHHRFPAITGIVIDGTQLQPSAAYYRLYGRNEFDFSWWEEQIRESIAFDWKPHYLQAEAEVLPPSATPKAADIMRPERAKTTTYRILRDTGLALDIKRRHSHRCQICGMTMELPDGSFYAEAHHIQPLGEPHCGPDIEGNIVCVCPNDHARLDLGALELDASTLHQADRSVVSQEYIDYHNNVIRSRWLKAAESDPFDA